MDEDGGVIDLRLTRTFQGDFVLCVKEGKRVSHYIINREDQGYRIGKSDFYSFTSRSRACLGICMM